MVKHNLKRDRSYQIQMEESHHTLIHSPHISASVFLTPEDVEHQWRSTSYTISKSGMEIGTSPESWFLHDILLDTVKDRWLGHMFTSRVLAQRTSKITKWVSFDPQTVHWRIFHQTAVFMHPSPTNSDSNDFDCEGLTDRNDQRAQIGLIDQNTIMGARIMFMGEED